MWKNSPEENESQETQPGPSQSRARTTTPAQRVASLGPSLVIRGTLSGEEDLVIEGRVEGEISLPKHSVTVGAKGRVKADIFSKSICVEGEVNGNLFGDDQVTIRKSGKVRGNVTSPRVTLEDGSKFKGAIDMKAPPPSSTSPENTGAEKASAEKTGAEKAAQTASAESAGAKSSAPRGRAGASAGRTSHAAGSKQAGG